jgi:hypothetical protein
VKVLFRREDVQAFIRILAEQDKRIAKLEEVVNSLLTTGYQRWAPPAQYAPQQPVLFDQELEDPDAEGEAQPRGIEDGSPATGEPGL